MIAMTSDRLVAAQSEDEPASRPGAGPYHYSRTARPSKEARMRWLRGQAGWLLMAMTVLVTLVGIWPIILGIKEDASVPLGISGMTAAQLEGASAQGYRLLDFQARNAGLALVVIGTLLSVVLLAGF